jgi:hypothetical protein
MLGISYGEYWYTTDRNGERPDIARYRHLTAPAGRDVEEFTTLCLDLTQPEQALLAAMSAGTRKQIREAEADDYVYSSWYPAPAEAVRRFLLFHAASARIKGFVPAEPEWLEYHRRRETLDVSLLSTRLGTPVVWHAYYRGGKHVRQKYSASLFRAAEDPLSRRAIGQANRYHHWRDIQRFREQGASVFDFGGWYPGKENQELLKVNAFKEEFGGRVVVNYHCVEALTAKGRAYLWARAAVGRFRTGGISGPAETSPGTD